MSDKIVLPMVTRTVTGKATRKLRAQGQTPAVVYGSGSAATAVTVDAKVLQRTYQQAGVSKILGIKIDDARQKNALIQDVQVDPVSGNLMHVDFYLVKMNEKLKTEIPLQFTGESTAVYQQEGILIRPLETIEIEALPGDLPESFVVDISILDDFEKTITVADLTVPEGVEILTPAEELVAKVEAPVSEEELEADLAAPIDEAAEMPEGALEESEVIDSPEQGQREEQNKAAGADPGATK